MKLNKAIYEQIGDIAKHCDWDKLKIAENHAFEYDLKEKLCDIWNRIDEITENEVAHNLVLRIWAFFSYARYVENSIFVDTASGFVRKDHSNSFPIPLSEIKDIAKQYRNMAFTEIDRLYYELCTSDEFFHDGKCHCKGKKCEKKIKNRLFRKKGLNVNRRDW